MSIKKTEFGNMANSSLLKVNTTIRIIFIKIFIYSKVLKRIKL